MKIPDKGLKKEDVLKALKSYKGQDPDWKSGRVLGYIYYPGDKAQDVIDEAYTMYLTENALDPSTFPSTLRLENEVVGMVAHLLRGDENVVGNFTSGGTESLILAVKTARDYARTTRPHIREPEMVLPVTAHASFYKAAHYLNVKPVITPVHDDSFLADVDAMRDAITDNTILLVGSAPGYAHGVVDPISEIAKLAQEKDLLCHVDGCVGGIHLSYMRKLGIRVPEFDFTVPGVTSISADLHKYGYAAKGASVVLYKNKELRKHQIFACSRWTGYTVINAAVTSSKTAGPMAAAWAVMSYIGDEGYMKIVREVMEATQIVIDGINRIDGLQVLGEPNMCMFSFASTSQKINVYRLADALKTKGWFLQPQFKRANSPANLHISMNRSTVHQAKTFLKVFEDTIEELKHEEVDDKTKELQAELEKLSIKFDDETFFKLAGMAGVTGTELPDKMETINQIMEVLPYDVSEWILIEYLNNLMIPGEK
ncbi:MAG: aspartate aminotransferase family protein [Desulfobacterales bacterium]|nr:MAG: aspartate aminotransferase family protein [Desulfobacterales bacterium]